MDESNNMWVGDRSSVEDAEEGSVLRGRVLAGRGEDLLESS
jgi:hypothetical protein